MKMSVYKILMSIRPAILGDIIKRIFQIQRKQIQISDLIFSIDPVSDFGYTILRDGKYEPALYDYLKRTLNEGDYFFDVGANEGYFSIVAAKLVGEEGRVIAIEPQSRLRSVIANNIFLNRLKNILFLPYIVSDRNEIAEIYLSPSTNSGSSGLTQRTRYNLPTESVPTYSLISIIDLLTLSKIKLIKIDVEGHEYEVVLGSKTLFQNQIIENIAMEYHPNELLEKGKSVSMIDEFLISCGYVGVQLDGFTVYSCLKGNRPLEAKA